MKLFYQKSFLKSYKNLTPQDRKKVDDALGLFEKDPFHSHLNNHLLKGALAGKRAFSAGFDLRVLYREEGDHVAVYLLKAGSHNQVY